MTVGELRKAIDGLDDAMQIEVFAAVEDDYKEQEGFDLCFDLLSVKAVTDPDTAANFLELRITPTYAPLDES